MTGVVDGKFKLSDLAIALMNATAGQSDVGSCLHWSFSRYGKIEPPKEGFAAYDDPDGETVDALASLARAAAAFFGYEMTPKTETTS